jgi:hypothetical protein
LAHLVQRIGYVVVLFLIFLFSGPVLLLAFFILVACEQST